MPRRRNSDRDEALSLLRKGQRLCRVCEQIKDLAAFGKSDRVPEGYMTTCKECVNYRNRNVYRPASIESRKQSAQKYRENNREKVNARERKRVFSYRIKKYGLTTEDFYKMWWGQQGRCAICFVFMQRKNQHIDHCHTTGRVRGLLCDGCNRGLGCFKDDTSALVRAASYLAP